MRYIILRYIILCSILSIMTIISSTLYSADNTNNSPRFNQMMGWGWGWSGVKSPGVAALLSLQPMPVDFGNFYVDDWKKGILYTSLELGVFVPGIMLMGNHGWGHHHSNDNDSWTDNERVTFYSLLAGYIAVKVVSAYDAASTAEKITYGNRFSLKMNAESHTPMIIAHLSF